MPGAFSLRQQHAKEKFSIYLAVTTYCRTWQLQAALPLCFLSTLPHRNTVTWVIADCNDRTDRESEVSTWLRRHVPAVLLLQHVFTSSEARRTIGPGGTRRERRIPQHLQCRRSLMRWERILPMSCL